jgi:hypothetical protein
MEKFHGDNRLEKENPSVMEVINKLIDQIGEKEKKLEDLSTKYDSLSKEQQKQIDDLLFDLEEKEAELGVTLKKLNYMYSSRAWKFAHEYYTMKDKAYQAKQLLKTFLRTSITQGPVVAVRKSMYYLKNKKVQMNIKEVENKKVNAIYRELRSRYNNGEIKGIAIVPSGFIFDELYNQRTINLAKYLSEQNYGVIYMPWQWVKGEKLEKSYQEVYENVYQVPLFDFLGTKSKLNEFTKMSEKYFFITFPTEVFYELIVPLRQSGFNIFYDIMDEWEEFKKVGQSPWYERKIEEAIVLNSDAIAVVSKPLSEKFNHLRNDISVIGNGYKPSQLKEANISLKGKTDDNKIHIGYFGHLTDAWFDWELIFNLVEKNQDVVVHVIGYGAPEHIEKKIEQTENIINYGKINPSDLHEHVKNWHIGIIPFTKSKLSEAVDPIKIYEYLYFGLPTVTTGIEHIGRYPLVEFCNEQKDFYPTIKNMYNQLLNSELDHTSLNQFLEETLWDSRFDTMMELAKKSNLLQGLYEND